MKHSMLLIVLNILILPTCVIAQWNIQDSTKPSFLISYCSENRKDTIEKPIHLDWVQKDKDIITNQLNKQLINTKTITELKKLLPNFIEGKRNAGRNITNLLGYGLKSTLHTIYGGYGSYNVDAVYFDNYIIKLRITIDGRKEIIEKYLFESITLPFNCLNGLPTYETTFKENVQKYISDSGQIFVESMDTNYRRKQAINYFTDVMTGGVFKEPYYLLFGFGTETFDNLRYFIVNKDFKALEDILYCPSSTSRLLAARTLKYLEEKSGYNPHSKVSLRIKGILQNAQLIRSGILSCWVGKFSYDYYDVVKDFEKYLTTL